VLITNACLTNYALIRDIINAGKMTVIIYHV
jgi:hypothetical protein